MVSEQTCKIDSGWDCFKTPILREILRTQNLLQVEHRAFLEVIHLFQKVRCVRSKHQFHTEIISLDAGLRLGGIPAFDFWDLIVFVLGNTTQNHDRTEKLVVCRDKKHVRLQSRGVINVLDNVDLVPSNVRFSHQEALLYVFEDNEALIKMITKGRNPTMRHVSRTHRIAFDLVVRSIYFGHPNPNQIH